jgi:hypothetical protein
MKRRSCLRSGKFQGGDERGFRSGRGKREPDGVARVKERSGKKKEDAETNIKTSTS